MSANNDGPTHDVLSRDEVIAQIDALTAGVAESDKSGVLAWTLWGLAPFSSRTDYLRVVHSLAWERHRPELEADAEVRALLQLAMARAYVADRAFSDADELLVAAGIDAETSANATLVRLHRALEIRARLHTGRISEALGRWEAGGLEGRERDPADFRAESELTAGLVALVRGQLAEAATSLNAAVQAASAHKREELAAWQVAVAMSASAHVSLRRGFPEHAEQAAGTAITLSERFAAIGELVDLYLVRAVYQLVQGKPFDAEIVQKARGGAALISHRGGAGDLCVGLAADVGGAADPGELVGRLIAASRERSEAFDGPLAMVAILAAAAVAAAHDHADYGGSLIATHREFIAQTEARGLDPMLAAAAVVVAG